MADVSVIIQLICEDEFNPPGIITLTINGTPKTVSVTSYGYTTGPLTYADGLPLAIVVTTSPKYYVNANLNTTAIEGIRQLQLELANETITCIWAVKALPTTLGRPIIKVDNNLWIDIARLDDISEGDIIRIDGIFLDDGTWRVDARSTSVGPSWQVTVTA